MIFETQGFHTNFPKNPKNTYKNHTNKISWNLSVLTGYKIKLDCAVASFYQYINRQHQLSDLQNDKCLKWILPSDMMQNEITVPNIPNNKIVKKFLKNRFFLTWNLEQILKF